MSLMSLLSDEELPVTETEGVVDEFSDTMVGCVPGNAGKSSLLMVNSVDSEVGAFTIPTEKFKIFKKIITSRI